MKPVAPLLLLAFLCACSRTAPVAPAESTPDHTAKAPAAVGAPAQQPATPAVAVGEPAPGTSPSGPDSLIRMDGYGDLRFGMTDAEARKAWHDGLTGDEVEPDNCAYLRPKADEDFRVGFMFEGGRFVRYDVDVAGVAAPGGGKAGMDLGQLRRLYAGRISEAPHHYVEGGKDVRVTDPAYKGGAIVFEVDPEGRVTRWRVGRAPQVDYVEGCS